MELAGRSADTPGEEHLLGQFIPLHYHFNMLQDEVRTGAFRDAIQARVKPGMHVLELGGGTGVLSYFAAQMGATVTCVERNPALVKKARELGVLNGVQDRVQIIHGDAAEFTPAQPVDLVICEMLHVALLREKQLAVIDAFKQNYLAAGYNKLPAFMPDSTLLGVQAIAFDFEFTGYHAPLPLFQDTSAAGHRSTELTGLTPYATVFYEEDFPQQFAWKGRLQVTTAGRFNALRFLTQNLLAEHSAENQPSADGQTIPFSQQPVTWANQLLVVPLAQPFTVQAGQHVDVAFDYSAGQPLEALTGAFTAEPAETTPFLRAA